MFDCLIPNFGTPLWLLKTRCILYTFRGSSVHIASLVIYTIFAWWDDTFNLSCEVKMSDNVMNNSDDPKIIQVCWRQWSVAGLPPMWNKLLFNAARLPSVSSNRNLSITVWVAVPFSCLRMCYSLDKLCCTCPVDCVRGYVAATMLMLTLLLFWVQQLHFLKETTQVPARLSPLHYLVVQILLLLSFLHTSSGPHYYLDLVIQTPILVYHHSRITL